MTLASNYLIIYKDIWRHCWYRLCWRRAYRATHLILRTIAERVTVYRLASRASVSRAASRLQWRGQRFKASRNTVAMVGIQKDTVPVSYEHTRRHEYTCRPSLAPQRRKRASVRH